MESSNEEVYSPMETTMEEEESQVDSSVEEHCIEDECKQVGRRGVSKEVKNYIQLVTRRRLTSNYTRSVVCC